MNAVRRTTSQHVAGGGTVVIILYSNKSTLVIRNRLKTNPLWKFIGETLEPDEPILNAVVAGAREEADFEIPAVWQAGVVTKAGNEQIIVKEVRPKRWLETRNPHWQYFYKVLMPESTLQGLSGKVIKADLDVEFETKAVEKFAPDYMPGFLLPHRDLFQEFKHLD